MSFFSDSGFVSCTYIYLHLLLDQLLY